MIPAAGSRLAMRRSYRVEAVALLLAMAAIATLCASLLWGSDGIWVALAAIALGFFFLPRLATAMTLKLFGAIPMAPDFWPDEITRVSALAARAGLKAAPALYRLPTDVGMAFSTGTSDEPAIAVSAGALQHLDAAELDGLYAHEIAHLASGDITLRTLSELMSRFTRALSLFGLLAALWLTFTSDTHIPAGVILVFAVAPTAIALLQLALSRNREYEADAIAVTLLGNARGLAAALRKLDDEQHSMLRRLFWPHARGEAPVWLRTHPRTADRIARLHALRPQDFAATGAHARGRDSGA
jgi:heat shock protein HtpX